jgi:diguanylate cyclase (GGDEF)-like protein/PAS domain S-box-containing protein
MSHDKNSCKELLDEIEQLNKKISKLELERAGDKVRIIMEREDHLSSIIKSIDVGLLLQGPNSEIILSNQQAFEMLGITEEQLMGRTSFDPSWNVIHEDGTPFLGENHPVPQAIETKMAVKEVIMGVYRPTKGDRVWLLVSAIPILNSDDSVKHVVCSFIDISNRKKIEGELQKSHNKLSILYEVYKNTTENLNLRELFDNALCIIKEAFNIDGIAIYTMDEDTQTLIFESSLGFIEEIIKEIQVVKKQEGLAGRAIITGNPQFTTYHQYPEGKFKTLLVNQGFKGMGSIPMIISNKAVGAISIAFKQEKGFDADEIQLLMAVSKQLGIAIQNAQLVNSLRNELSERLRAEEAMRIANETINEKNKLLQKVMATLEIESKIDSLTGLYNRRYILGKINEEIIRYKRSGKEFSVVIADIDFFKKVNDTYGHDFGDVVLKDVSEILKSTLREQDCISRWGGEEFLILIVESDLKRASLIANRMREKIEEKIFEHNFKKLSVTMTFGVSVYSDNESIDDMIKKADDALYKGKKTGRNRVVTA